MKRVDGVWILGGKEILLKKSYFHRSTKSFIKFRPIASICYLKDVSLKISGEEIIAEIAGWYIPKREDSTERVPNFKI